MGNGAGFQENQPQHYNGFANNNTGPAALLASLNQVDFNGNNQRMQVAQQPRAFQPPGDQLLGQLLVKYTLSNFFYISDAYYIINLLNNI